MVNILDADALTSHPEIPRTSFDVLVANPPFAVEGFLQTLSDADKKQYQLIQATGESSDTDTIECFFLERLHHLMVPGGVVGVIAPSSILDHSKSAVHTCTREILLQFFDLVSIAELGGGTFGKTTTKTVVLFLRRKVQRPEASEHYHNRVEDFFEGDHQSAEYQDDYLIKAYCEHIEIPYDEYIKLFAQTSVDPLVELLQYDIFNDYKRAFSQSTEIKNLKKSSAFKRKTAVEQSTELEQRFIDYLHAIEKDKLYYFILAHEQDGKVLIVNAPNTSTEQKQFLGYWWSKAKGKEGIKYSGGKTVNDIITPLFDPKDLDNGSKINTAIKCNFGGEIINPLPEYCQYAKLTDMLDFSRTDFNKVISLNPKQNTDINTQWPLVKLGEVCNLQGGNTFKVIYQGNKDNTQIPFFKVSDMNSPENSKVMTVANNYVEKTVFTQQIKATLCSRYSIVFPKVGMSIHTDKKRILGCDGGIDNNIMAVSVLDTNRLVPLFLLEVFNQFIRLGEIASNASPPSISEDNLQEIKIPLPPLEVQRQIVNECDAVDQETNQAHQTIAATKQRIEELVSPVKKTARLNQVVDRISHTVNPKGENGFVYYVGLENIESQTGVLLGDIQSDFSAIKSNKNVFRRGDLLYGKLRPNLNKVHLTNIDGICSTDILVLRPYNPNLATFYKHYFLSKAFNSEVVKTTRGQHRPRTSWEEIDRILVPPLDIPQQLVAEVEQLDAKIPQSQAMIDKAAERKNAILTNYL